jgi:hypothetical protein
VNAGNDKKMIDDYVTNTYGKLVPYECFSLERDGEKKRF